MPKMVVLRAPRRVLVMTMRSWDPCAPRPRLAALVPSQAPFPAILALTTTRATGDVFWCKNIMFFVWFRSE